MTALAGPDTTRAERPRVLVIENNDSVRLVIGQLLEAAGFTPLAAKTASEAEQILSEAVDAMVLDFRLTGSRGDLFFYFASSKYPHLRSRTVFLTGDTSAEVESLVAHTGCVLRYKPFVDSALMSLLWSMVARDTPQSAPTG